jgi:hypothetical protein
MQDRPGPANLVAATADFLRRDLMPSVDGATAFQLRVAINALDLVVRELHGSGATDAEERTRLITLLGEDGALDDLNRRLCRKLRSGALDLSSPGLADHLWTTTLAKLAVDQPNYAAYKREIARGL